MPRDIDPDDLCAEAYAARARLKLLLNTARGIDDGIADVAARAARLIREDVGVIQRLVDLILGPAAFERPPVAEAVTDSVVDPVSV